MQEVKGSKEEKNGHSYTEPTVGEPQKGEKGSENGYHETEEGIEKELRKKTVRKIREQGGNCCKLLLLS